MSSTFQKRGRHSRSVAIRLSCDATSDWRDLLNDRAVIARLSISAVAIALIVIGVQGWSHAFPHRLGETPDDGVAALIDFSRVNREQTQSRRDRAAEKAPLVFNVNETLHRQIVSDFRDHLAVVRGSRSLDELPFDVRRAFGLTEANGSSSSDGVRSPEWVAGFERLKAACDSEPKLAETIEAFGKFLSVIEKTGLIREEHLPNDRGVSVRAEIRDTTGGKVISPLAQVDLPKILSDGGELGRRWLSFPTLTSIRSELEAWLRSRSPETLEYDKAATQKLRQEVADAEEPVIDKYKVGSTLVVAGQSIDEAKLELLQAEYRELEAQIPLGERILRILVVSLMLGVLSVLIGYHLVQNEPKLLWNLPRFTRYIALIVVGIWLGRWLSFDPWRAEIGAVLTVVMVCVIIHNQVLATLTAFAMSVVVTTACGGDMGRFTVMMSVCSTAVILLPSVPTRSTLVTVGAAGACVCLLMHWGTALIESSNGVQLWTNLDHWSISLRSAGWCLAAGFLVSGSLPFIEAWFGAVTDISLLELGDVSHPLLQELVRRAPGTYNHSITVASIGESAADSIGANGLLVRVGAYFHDIGKMLKPHYFIENNLGGENRHDHLAPAMSTLIIIGHVKDGVDLARQQGLPEPLLDFIEQHHGTTLVEYFYHEATRLAEEQPDHRHDVQESSFRYPGPKPQTRESAVLMISDAVEGASRALSEPTASRIERLVHDIVMKRLLDGQFSECGLTLNDLDHIEDSLTKSLTAMYHGRIKYPDQKSA